MSSYESFRLLHCHAPRLDASLSEVEFLNAGQQALACDATLEAFENAITSAIEHHADLVLITGELFGDGGPTLRGLARLRDGLSCLDDEEIAVYLSIDEKTQQMLRQGPWLGHGSVQLISPYQKQPLSLAKDKQPLASIAFAHPQTGERSYRLDPPQMVHDRGHLKVAGSSLFSILVLQGADAHEHVVTRDDHRVDLLIRCGEEFRLQPTSEPVEEIFAGPLQGLSRHHVGQLGASLIIVNGDKEVRQTFLPCQTIQRERLDVQQSSDMDETQMLARMQQQLERVRVSSTTKLLLCEWNLVGYDDNAYMPNYGHNGNGHHSGPHYGRRFVRHTTINHTAFSFASLRLPKNDVPVLHRFSASDELRLPRLLERHQLAQEYLKLAEEYFPDELENFQRHLSQWSRSLPQELAVRLQDLDSEKLIEFAVNYGTHWFIQAAEEVAA